MFSHTIAGAVLVILLIWFFYAIAMAVTEFMKPTVHVEPEKFSTVYPFEYDKNNPFHGDVEGTISKMKEHWRREAIMASARYKTLEAFEAWDEQIYLAIYWPEHDKKAVACYLEIAREAINNEV